MSDRDDIRRLAQILDRFRGGWCLEHERPIAKCSELAWRDYGVWLFSNCEADAKQATPAAEAATAVLWDAARATARDAARDAAQDAQYRRLCAYLEGAPTPPVEPLYGKETPGE